MELVLSVLASMRQYVYGTSSITVREVHVHSEQKKNRLRQRLCEPHTITMAMAPRAAADESPSIHPSAHRRRRLCRLRPHCFRLRLGLRLSPAVAGDRQPSFGFGGHHRAAHVPHRSPPSVPVHGTPPLRRSRPCRFANVLLVFPDARPPSLLIAALFGRASV